MKNLKNLKSREQLFETVSSETSDLDVIKPFLKLARKSAKVKDIMDSPIVSPKGYKGDPYFTIEYLSGKYDMITAKGGEVIIDKDIEAPVHGPMVGGKAISLEEFDKLMQPYLRINSDKSSENKR